MLSTRSRPILRAGAALLLVPALAATLLGSSDAHAASGPVHTHSRPAKHVKSATVRPHVVHAHAVVVAPTGHAVVTACTTAGLVAALNTGNVITFACNPATSVAKVGGKYVIVVPQTDSPAIPISGGTLSIDGSDRGANDIAIDGGATSATTGVQIFFTAPTTSLTLANLTVQNGNASNGTSTSTTPITGSTDDGHGGAAETFGTFSASNVTFLNNMAFNYGGALELNAAASFTLKPALGAKAAAPVAAVTDSIVNSTFTGNVADNELDGNAGGAISIGENADGFPQTVTISHDTFTTNKTAATGGGDGGAVWVDNGEPATVGIDHSLFSGNTADGAGGALVNDFDDVTVTDSQFTGNTANRFGGGAVEDFSDESTTILRSSFINNSAPFGIGGAFLTKTRGTDVVANSTFSGNSAKTSGAGLSLDSASATLVADTIAGNTIVAGGTAGAAAGIVNTATVSIQANIISNNVNLASGPTTVVNCSGAITDNGYNLEYSAGSPNTCTSAATGDVTGVDPLLSAPADNGGPNVGAPGSIVGLQTMALAATSPAIGIVIPPICTAPPVSDVDGRTLPRNSVARGGCDAGAYDTNLAGGLATTAVTNPLVVTGAINALFGAGFRLGFAASSPGVSFPLGYITFQKGASSFVVRQPVLVSCIGQCLGVANDLIPNATATVTLTGEISTGRGAYLPDQTVVVTLTLMTGPRAALGTVPIAVTLSAVSVSVNAVPVASATGPFTLPSSFHAVLPAAM